MPSWSMIAAARTGPMPGRASSSSTIRIRAIASSLSPSPEQFRDCQLPRFQPVLGRGPGRPGRGGLPRASARSCGVRGRKLTECLPALSDGPLERPARTDRTHHRAVPRTSPEPTVLARQKSMDKFRSTARCRCRSGPRPACAADGPHSGRFRPPCTRSRSGCAQLPEGAPDRCLEVLDPRAGAEDIPAGGARTWP